MGSLPMSIRPRARPVTQDGEPPGALVADETQALVPVVGDHSANVAAERRHGQSLTVPHREPLPWPNLAGCRGELRFREGLGGGPPSDVLGGGHHGAGSALVSRRIRRWPVSEPLLALVAGVVIGPVVLGLVRVDEPVLQPLLLESTRLLLAGSVMAAALRFPACSLRAVLRPVLILLAVVMPAAALVVGAAAFWLGLPLGPAAVLGACLSPTDPVLAAAVVCRENRPSGISRSVRLVV
jgi:hypothetical protein